MNAARLRTVCLSLPGATETIQWGDNRVFKVGGRMFAVSGHGPDSLYSFKVDDARFLELTDVPGIRPAPYLARAKWVQVDPALCPLAEHALVTLVRDGYRIIFSRLTKKLQRSVDSDGDAL